MIQQIINGGMYEFKGTIIDLKKCLSSFKVTSIICDGTIQDIELYEAMGKFRYHGVTHKVHVSKHWGGKDILYIEYRGAINGESKKEN